MTKPGATSAPGGLSLKVDGQNKQIWDIPPIALRYRNYALGDTSAYWGRCHPAQYPQGDIERHAIGYAKGAADSVRSQGYRVEASDVDSLENLDRIIDLDAQMASRAFAFRASKDSVSYCGKVDGVM